MSLLITFIVDRVHVWGQDVILLRYDTRRSAMRHCLYPHSYTLSLIIISNGASNSQACFTRVLLSQSYYVGTHLPNP